MTMSLLLALLNRCRLYVPVLLTIVTVPNAVTADQYKIGVVDAMAVLEQSPQAEKMATELRIEFENRNRHIIELQKEVTDLNERLSNLTSELSQAETAQLERELYLKNRELQRMENEYKEDLSDRRNEILSALQDEIVEAIMMVSEQYQFDIVLTGGVNWASPRVNMTPLVVEYLKNKLTE